LGEYLLYFTIGILYYMLYSKKQVHSALWITIAVFFVLQYYIFLNTIELLIFCSFILLFAAFVYKPQLLSFLNIPLFSTIGLVSYPLYLLHNHLGTAMINRLSYLLNSEGVYDLMIVAFVIAFFVALAYIVDRYYDRKVQKFLKNKFLAPKPERLR
jgi:peptidoglycan/LPS O-acetylase OafA/YrhL